MCGVTANNQDGNYQVNDLQLNDNKRAALVSSFKCRLRLKLKYPFAAAWCDS